MYLPIQMHNFIYFGCFACGDYFHITLSRTTLYYTGMVVVTELTPYVSFRFILCYNTSPLQYAIYEGTT